MARKDPRATAAYIKKWRRENRERCAQYAVSWRKKNRERYRWLVRAGMRRFRVAHHGYDKEYLEVGRRELADWYVAGQLGMLVGRVPDAIMEAKRTQLMLSREIRRITQ
jgi:hypothetical protein